MGSFLLACWLCYLVLGYLFSLARLEKRMAMIADDVYVGGYLWFLDGFWKGAANWGV